MRFLAALLCTFALAQGFTREVWPQGKEFIYEYKGRVMASIPNLKEQITGLGIKCDLVLQVVSPNTILAKMTKLQMGKINKELHRVESYRSEAPLEWVPMEREAEELLSTPFKINLKSGLIVSLEVPENEPTWSVNLKKGLVTQLNVNLEKVNRIPFELTNAKTYEDKSFRNLKPQSSPEHEFFVVEEDFVGGNCKTAYTVVPLNNYIARMHERSLPTEVVEENASSPDSSAFIVIKTRDLDECDRRPSWVHFPLKDISPMPCNPAQGSCHKFSTRTSVTRYLLRKSPSGNHFRLERAFGESEFLVRPYGVNTERLWSVSNQTLSLLGEGPVTSTISVPSNLRHTSLKYEFPVPHPESEVNMRRNENPAFESMRKPEQTISEVQERKSGESKYNYGQKQTGYGYKKHPEYKSEEEDEERLAEFSHHKKPGNKKYGYGHKHQPKQYGQKMSSSSYPEPSWNEDSDDEYSPRRPQNDNNDYDDDDEEDNYDNFSSRSGVRRTRNARYFESEIHKTEHIRNIKNFYPSLREPAFYMCPMTSARMIRSSPVKQQIVSMINEVEREIDEFEDLAEKESSLKILQIARAFTILSYSEIEQVYREVVSESHAQKAMKTKKTLLLDALVMSGTHPAIMFIKDLIIKNELRGEAAAQLISMIPMSVKSITPELIAELIKLVKSPVVKPSEQPRNTNQVWITTLLAIGNMINYGCVSPKTKNFNYVQEPRGIPLCKKNDAVITKEFIPLLEQGLESSSKVWKQMVFIHALGNTGHPEIIKVLESYILGKTSKDPQVRTKAVYALTRVAELVPSKVYMLLRPVYSNVKDHYAVRMAAFETLIHTEPSPVFFTTVCTGTWFEPSQQVGSYVYSTIASLANSTLPLYRNISRMAEMALPLCKKFELGAQYSRNMFVTNYNDEDSFGSLLQLSMLGSTKSLIPRVLYARLVKNIGDFNFDLFQSAIHVEGLQETINQIWHGQSPIHNTEALFSVLNKVRRSLESTDLHNLEDKLFQTFNIKPRKSDPLNVAVWVKLFGGMERFVNFNYMTLLELLGEAAPTVTENGVTMNINYQKALNTRSMTIVLPMDMGVPVYFSKKSPTLISIRGKVELEGEWSALSRGKIPDIAGIKFDLKPVVSQNTLIEMGIICPIAAEAHIAGVNTHNLIALPIKAKVMVNIPEKKISFEAESASGKLPTVVDLVHMHQRPFTCIKKLSDFLPMNRAPEVNYIRVLKKPYYNETIVGQHWLGLPIKMVEKLDQPFSSWSGHSYDRMMRQNPVSLALFFGVPSSLRSYEYKLSVDTSRCQTEKIMGHISYSKSGVEKEIWSLEPEREIESKNYRHKSTHYTKTEREVRSFFQQPFASISQMLGEEERSSKSLEYEPTEFVKSVESRKSYENSKYSSPLEMDDESRPSGVSKTHSIHAEVKCEGPVPRIYRASVMTASTPEKAAQKLSIHFEKEGGVNAQPYKVFVNGMIRYPLLPRTPEREALIESDMTTVSNVVVRFGREVERAINAKIVMTRTGKQQMVAKESQAAKRCAADESKGMRFSESCTLARQKATTLNKYVIQLEGENLPKSFVNTTYAIDNFVKYALYPYLTVDSVGHRNPKDRVTIIATVEPPTTQHPYRVLDILTFKPLENAFFKTIKLPPFVAAFFPLNAKTPIVTKALNTYLGEDYTPRCTVGERSIETFDNVTIKYQLPACYHLIAKDCSMRTNIAVLAKQLPQGEKIVKIIAGPHEIEIIPQPESNLNRPKLLVKIDGSIWTPTSEAVHELKRDGSVIIAVSKRRDGEVTVHCPTKGLKVITGGFNVKIEASNMLRGRLCGLCGDFNGEKMAELMGPRGCVFTHPHKFGRSYMLPGADRCNTAEVPEIESSTHTSSWEPEDLYEEFMPRELLSNPNMCLRSMYEPVGETESRFEMNGANRRSETLFGLPEELFTNVKPEFEDSPTRMMSDDDDEDEESKDYDSMEMKGARPCVRYITKVVRKEDKICFSVKPVPECNLSCKPTKFITKEIGYHCKPLEEESRRHMASARFGIVREMLGKTPHFSSHTSLPESCEMITV